MAISQNSKLTLKQEIERLESKKKFINSRIDDLKKKRDILIIQRDEINSKLDELTTDSA